MFRLIEKLRQKPDRVKKMIALGTAFVFSSSIFIVWLTVIYPDFRNSKEQVAAVSEISETPVNNITSALADGLLEISKSFGEIKEMIGSLSSTSTAYYVGTSTSSISSSSTPNVDEN